MDTYRSLMRRLFTILSALSLLLCMGTYALWIHSYQKWEMVSYGSGSHVLGAFISRRANLGVAFASRADKG